MTPKVDEVDYNMLSQIYENTKINSKMLSSIMSSLNELTLGGSPTMIFCRQIVKYIF